MPRSAPRASPRPSPGCSRAPYLPGVRSRLWLRIEATPAEAGPGTEPQPTLGLESAPPLDSGSPVLAVIRRLPLEWD